MVNFKWDDQRAREVAQEELQMVKAEAKEEAKAAKAKGLAEGLEKGQEKGVTETRHEVALDMLKHNMPVTLVTQISKLSLEQVKEIAKKNNLAVV